MKTTAAKRHKKYTITDGSLVLTLESDGKWLVVTSPFDPELVTQARTIDEAFTMAYDAKKLLDECRAERAREIKAAEDPVKTPRKKRASGPCRKRIGV
ncbi:MAG: type II toxin-antitoxin system HicB family antitoxin [Planctomycetaceae bacterium]|nr:type II toxin-antitoxin system HicB family antitoxin [Planctomycetaceae bacterium]